MLATLRCGGRGVAAARCLHTSSNARSQGLEATLPCGGGLRGRLVVPTSAAPPFQAFVGIPYAKPPVGKLRFKPPEPHEGWAGVRQASDEPDPCVQADYHSEEVVGSEDCLRLSVFRPAGTGPGCGKPVLVYIHNSLWSHANPCMNEVGPEFFVAKDIVVVVIYHRLHAFGFLCLNSPTVPGNMGIRDCIMALRWVGGNIRALGGDPERVTLGGHGAGAVIAHQLQFVDECKGLFQRSIALAGSVANTWYGAVPADVGRLHALKLARQTGCHTTNDEEVLSHLQSLPAREVFDHMRHCAESPVPCDRANPAFPVVVDGPAVKRVRDAVVPESPVLMLRCQRQHAVPTLFGVTREDGHIFRGDSKLWAGHAVSEEDLPLRYAQLERFLPWDLDLGPLDSVQRQQIVKDIRQLYFDNKDTPTMFQMYELISDLTIISGTIESARRHACHPTKPPTYLYCFSVEGRFNRGRKKHNLPPGLVVHSDELGYLFGCRDEPPGPEPEVPSDSIEATTRRRIVGLLANFVKTGNPTPEGDPDPNLRGVNWPTLPSSLAAPYPYLEVGRRLSVKYELYGARARFWQSVYDSYFTTGDTPQARKPMSWHAND